MLYISSQAVGDGTLSIDVVFKPGTNVLESLGFCEISA
jgi:hypothetical protein